MCIRHIAGVTHTGQLIISFDITQIEDLFTNQISSYTKYYIILYYIQLYSMHSYYNSRCPTSFNNFLTSFRGKNRTKSFVLDPLLKSL